MPGNGYRVVQRWKQQEKICQQIQENKNVLLQKLEMEIRLYERHKENTAFVTLHEHDIKQRLYSEDSDRYYQFKDFALSEIASTFYSEKTKRRLQL